jgi:hypothetical protein
MNITNTITKGIGKVTTTTTSSSSITPSTTTKRFEIFPAKNLPDALV